MNSKVFDVVDSFPHVSLSKKNNDHWEDIGLFVKMCIFHVNWVETAEENVEYSPTLSAYRMFLHKPAVKAVRMVCVIDDAMTTHSHALLSRRSRDSPSSKRGS